MNMIAFGQTDIQSVIELQGVTKVYGTGQAAMYALRGLIFESTRASSWQ
jgi:hypothetical protein